MKKRSLLIIAGVLVAAIVFFITRVNGESSGEKEVTVEVQRGTFKSEVTASGELFAKKSVKIMGPESMQQAGVWETTISDIIEEGTIVQPGDYVATLDQSQLGQRIEQKQNDLKISTAEFTAAKLDTAIELRKTRDELDNMLYLMEKQRLVLQNSEFEPPAVIREKEIDLERAETKYERAKENYILQSGKAVARMQTAQAKLDEDQNRLNFLLEVSKQFTITAPESGMLIYKRDWRGNKIAQGGRVAGWDPTVATLPDLTKMVSKTFINEVDINNVQQGQKVSVGLDAFPDKSLTGTVIEVANMGQQRPNSDAKVFEILIEVNESDTTLRPGMTTSNNILAEVMDDVLYLPVEGIHSQGDSITYAIFRGNSGIVKQEVLLGQSNADEVIILAGLEEGNVVFLSDPEGVENKPVRLLDQDKKREALARRN